MAHVLVFYSASKVKIVHLVPGYSAQEVLDHLYRDGVVATPETPKLFIEETTLPRDRSRRHAWRVENGRVVDDPSIPNRTRSI